MQIDIEDVRRLNVKAGETLIIRFPTMTTGSEELRDAIRERLPDGVNFIMICGADVEMDVVADDKAAMHDPARP